MFGNNIEGMKWNHFMIILLLDLYFKINGWIYRGILEVLVKNLLNLISFLLIPWKFEILREKRGMIVSSYPFHSLPLKLQNKRMNFLFSSLKFSNKGKKEYYKIILFIHFHSLPFTLPKRGLKVMILDNKILPFSITY